MISLTLPRRRAAIVLLAVLIGLSGLVSPAAQAAPPKPDRDVVVTGDLIGCNHETGEWILTWTVSNWYLNAATIRDLKTTPVPVPGLTDGLAIDSRYNVDQRVFTQMVPGTARAASVSFTAAIGTTLDTDNSDVIAIDGVCKEDEKPCVGPENATFHHEFAISGTQATATVTLDSGVKLCADEPVTLASYFAPKPRFAVPQYVFDHQTGTITNDNRRITLVTAVPACDTQVDLFFGDEHDVIAEITENGPRYGDRKLGSRTGSGARSKGVPAWFNGGDQGCRQPDVAHDDKCDGVVAVHLSNTGDLSRYAVDFTVTAGQFTRTVTVQPGKAETVDVPAGAGEITVTADGMPARTITWKRPADCAAPAVVVQNDCQTVTVTVTNPEGVVPATAEITYGGAAKTVTVAAGTSERVTFPAGAELEVTVAFPGLGLEPVKAILEKPDCATPTPTTPTPTTPTPSPSATTGTPGTGAPGGGGDGGGLPVTGAATGGIAAGAGALLIAGAVLMFLARRRRTRFSA